MNRKDTGSRIPDRWGQRNVQDDGKEVLDGRCGLGLAEVKGRQEGCLQEQTDMMNYLICLTL